MQIKAWNGDSQLQQPYTRMAALKHWRKAARLVLKTGFVAECTGRLWEFEGSTLWAVCPKGTERASQSWVSRKVLRVRWEAARSRQFIAETCWESIPVGGYWFARLPSKGSVHWCVEGSGNTDENPRIRLKNARWGCSRTLQIKAMYKAECWRTKGRLLRSRGEEQICRTPEAKDGCHKPDGSVCVETAQPPTSNENERKQNGRGLGPNTKDHIERPLHCWM